MTATAQQTFTITREQLLQFGQIERRASELEELAEQIRELLGGFLRETIEGLDSDSARDQFMERFDSDVHALEPIPVT
jgi:hypothetical protein